MSQRLEKKKETKTRTLQARNTLLEQINKDLMHENEDLCNELRMIRIKLENLKDAL